MKHWLFAYGTLQDEEIQQVLFGYCCASRKACLVGWSLYSSTEEDYLFIKPNPSGSVPGKILGIDGAALAKADKWEEVPLYQREMVVVALEDGTKLEAWIYTRRNAEGKPYSGTKPFLLDRKSVLDAAANINE